MAEPLTDTGAGAVEGEQAARLARLLRAQFGFVWRMLRRIGTTEAETEAAVHEVFAAATQRLCDIRAGNERPFMFSTTLHVAAQFRRNRGEQSAISDRAPALEDLDEQGQHREMLGALLEQMPLELRVVFVLHEIEQLSVMEIGVVAGIPVGTVAERLAEAQEHFASHLELESELARALLVAAREEHAPEGTLARVLKAAGLSRALLASDSEAVSASPGELSARSAALVAAQSPMKLAARWLLFGWFAGLALAAVYALTRL